MTTLEKIQQKKKSIEIIDNRILELEEKKKKIIDEIEHLEFFEIKGLLNSIDLPYPQVISLLKEAAAKKER